MKRQTALRLAFIAMLVITSFFAFRLIVSTVIWSDPGRMDQEIAGWMTPRYVIKSWQVPPEVIALAVGQEFASSAISSSVNRRPELEKRNLDDLINDLESAIADFRAGSND